jgi:RNase P/RNase MRP subunit p30
LFNLKVNQLIFEMRPIDCMFLNQLHADDVNLDAAFVKLATGNQIALQLNFFTTLNQQQND